MNKTSRIMGILAIGLTISLCTSFPAKAQQANEQRPPLPERYSGQSDIGSNDDGDSRREGREERSGDRLQRFLEHHPNFEKNHPEAYQYMQQHPEEAARKLEEMRRDRRMDRREGYNGDGNNQNDRPFQGNRDDHSPASQGNSQNMSAHNNWGQTDVQNFLKNHPDFQKDHPQAYQFMSQHPDEAAHMMTRMHEERMEHHDSDHREANRHDFDHHDGMGRMDAHDFMRNHPDFAQHVEQNHPEMTDRVAARHQDFMQNHPGFNQNQNQNHPNMGQSRQSRAMGSGGGFRHSH